MLERLVKFLCLAVAICEALGREFMPEKPDFFRPCLTEDLGLNKCYAENIQALIRNFQNGIPGLPSAGRFEPVRVKKLYFLQNQLKIGLFNMTISGLGATIINDSRINPEDFTFKLKVIVPKMRVESNYRTAGRIMFLPINGDGFMWLESENVTLILGAKVNLVQEFNSTFFDIQKMKTKIKSIDRFSAHLDNLFNGNKILEAHINEIFNANWRDVLEALRPTLEEGISTVLLGRFKKIFNYIPADYLIADLPKDTPKSAQ